MARLRFWRRHRRSGDESLPVGSIVPGQAATALPVPDLPQREEPEASAPEVPADVPEVPSGPRVGLVFGDGTHVVLDPTDPRAGRFAALAEELNR